MRKNIGIYPLRRQLYYMQRERQDLSAGGQVLKMLISVAQMQAGIGGLIAPGRIQ